jgi:hypothetical protein
MRGILFWFLLCLIFLCLFPTASALNVTAKVGESYIIYNWEPNHTVNVYIDGIKRSNNTTFHDYYLTNINPDERHQIKIYNASNTTQLLGSLTAITLHSQNIILILICLLIAFFIILLLVKDPIKVILIGAVSASISIYTVQISLGYGALMIIPVITGVISGIFVAYALWTIIIEKTQW